jgi:hypothetical protein
VINTSANDDISIIPIFTAKAVVTACISKSYFKCVSTDVASLAYPEACGANISGQGLEQGASVQPRSILSSIVDVYTSKDVSTVREQVLLLLLLAAIATIGIVLS